MTCLGADHFPRLEINETIAGIKVLTWRKWLEPANIIPAIAIIIDVDYPRY
jgi:hypothetical protein